MWKFSKNRVIIWENINQFMSATEGKPKYCFLQKKNMNGNVDCLNIRCRLWEISLHLPSSKQIFQEIYFISEENWQKRSPDELKRNTKI